jgi:hypothetical protein
MKRFLFTFLILTFVGLAKSFSQEAISVTITDLNNDALTANVQNNISALLAEINRAYTSANIPNLTNMDIDDRTKTSIQMMWETSKFKCEDKEIVEIGMQTYNGEYEVRNIPIIFPEAEKDDQYHEVAITFDRTGKLTSFHVSISQNLYIKAMECNDQVTDFKRRQIILDFVEQFRTAYNTKDINFLNQVFSDDALIITGKMVLPKKEHSDFTISNPKVVYKKQDKKTYLSNLSKVFKANKLIRVTFDDIKVTMHPIDANWYGVTLHQGYTSDRYHDDGWLFLVWDFSDETHPVIHVRTWQPDMATMTNGKFDEEKIFSLDNFNISK